MSQKFRGEKSSYSKVFHFCAALTNFHVSKHPLRIEDGEFFRRLTETTIRKAIEVELAEKEASSQARKRRRDQALGLSSPMDFREFSNADFIDI